jgi:hypothetical protein
MRMARPSPSRRKALKWATAGTALVWGTLSASVAVSRCEPDDRGPGPVQSATGVVAASGGADASNPPPVLVEKPDGRFEGPICGLCPPDLGETDASADASELPETDDWKVLLDHPFSVGDNRGVLGENPADLRGALSHEVAIGGVATFREAAIRLWKGRLQQRWVDDRRLELQRAVRMPAPDWREGPDDFLVAAWHRQGRWLQVMRGERAFALRTGFDPRCGPSPAEQTAAALALGEKLLRAVPTDLCLRRWLGGGGAHHVWSFIAHPEEIPCDPSEWPLTMAVRIEDEKVLLSFAIPHCVGHFGPTPPWFARKVAKDDAIEE